jgi:hypothetical protein
MTIPAGSMLILFTCMFALIIPLLFLIFFELKIKVTSVTFAGAFVKTRNFFGFGKAAIISISAISGYQTSVAPAELGGFGVLYLLRDNKPAVRISEHYHANYQELKEYISIRVKNKGLIDYNLYR